MPGRVREPIKTCGLKKERALVLSISTIHIAFNFYRHEKVKHMPCVCVVRYFVRVLGTTPKTPQEQSPVQWPPPQTTKARALM
jgi:hypothetical protein